jgi:hypothetical protein
MFGFDGPFVASSPLVISPATSKRVVGHGFTFSTSGGTGSGYVYSFVSNNSGGTINSGTGAYVAGATPNVTDTIRVTDSGANTSDATVDVKDVIVISPHTATKLTGQTQLFTATGGVNPGGPAFQFVINNSGGSINGTTGLYTAGATPNVTDTVRATDVQSNQDLATISVLAHVSVSPSTPTVPPLGTQTFVASGGSGTGFVYTLSVNNSGGSINSSSGLYTAGSSGSVVDTVLVTDSLGNTGTTTVNVGPNLSISPASPSVHFDSTQAFTGVGGSGTGLVWSLSVNNSGGSINVSTGLYTAGPTFGVSDTVHLVDSLGNVANTTVSVTRLIATWDIEPSPSTQGNLRFTLVSSDTFDMFLVHEGDLVYIYGDEFQPTNTNGTFTIKVVFVTDSEKWFEIENPLGIEMLGVEQINFTDLMFFRPKRRTIYDNPRRVIVCENEQ